MFLYLLTDATAKKTLIFSDQCSYGACGVTFSTQVLATLFKSKTDFCREKRF